MTFHLSQSWVEKIFSAGKGEEELPSLVLGPRRECRVVVRWERVWVIQPEVSRETRVVQGAAMLTHVGTELGIHWIVGNLGGSSLTFFGQSPQRLLWRPLCRCSSRPEVYPQSSSPCISTPP